MDRCEALTTAGTRCKFKAIDPDSGLCGMHATRLEDGEHVPRAESPFEALVETMQSITGVVQPPEETPARPAELLAGWWREQAEAEIEMVVAKAIEYGARDLKVMGHELAAMANREISDEEAAELGCAMYLTGKMARVTAAIAEGRRPSLDTYLDIGIYTRMVQRIREVGAWPGV
jgi:hypothetical protein